MPFSALPVDRDFLSQATLDLTSRARLSRLPWKGQFTPEFVDVLLDAYLPEGGVVLDPFAGSGTVLFEAVRRGVDSYGAEINDAALVFSRVAELGRLGLELRLEALAQAKRLLDRWPQQRETQRSLWSDTAHERDVIEAARSEPRVWRLVSAALVLAQATRSKIVRSSVLEALTRLGEIVLESATPGPSCHVYRADARALPLDDETVDLVVTSPPYINVHNYHQYARVAVELLGGDPLGAAKSEIGANRKFRQNRFLTVVQYAIDMAEVLAELRRVVDPAGRVVVVLGRESRVRGITFENGNLLTALARREESFEVRRRMERSFVNRFGAQIFEDVIELVPSSCGGGVEVGRLVGIEFLKRALRGCLDEEQKRDLTLAVNQAESVPPSPILRAASERASVA
jgi:16S rRNA G966 N2-methylase RsmD